MNIHNNNNNNSNNTHSAGEVSATSLTDNKNAQQDNS